MAWRQEIHRGDAGLNVTTHSGVIPRRVHQVVCLTGPPAAGKSTVAAALSQRAGAHVFRLRSQVPCVEVARTCTTAQVAGWLSDDVVREALVAFFRGLDRFGPGVVVMDNFPGNGDQLRLLVGATQACLGRTPAITVFELRAGEALRGERARERLACAACEPDPLGDPRLPAAESSLRSGRCARCGGRLVHRRGDVPDVLAVRTRRYEANAGPVRVACEAAGIPMSVVDAEAPVAVVVAQIEESIIRWKP